LRLTLRPSPSGSCFIPVALMGFYPSELFPLEEPVTSRCHSPPDVTSPDLHCFLQKRNCRCPIVSCIRTTSFQRMLYTKTSTNSDCLLADQPARCSSPTRTHNPPPPTNRLWRQKSPRLTRADMATGRGACSLRRACGIHPSFRPPLGWGFHEWKPAPLVA
jgi:hypothetical protein